MARAKINSLWASSMGAVSRASTSSYGHGNRVVSGQAIMSVGAGGVQDHAGSRPLFLHLPVL